MRQTSIRITLTIVVLCIIGMFFIYFTKNTSQQLSELFLVPTVSYTTKSTGPLEPDNTYLELLPTPGLATSSREKINTSIHKAALRNSCFYAKPFDRKKISDYLNGLESDKYIDPNTLDDNALLTRFSLFVPHEIIGDFSTTYNKNGLLSITHQTYDSYCDLDTRNVQGRTNHYTYDLITGEQIVLTNTVANTMALQDSLREKIYATYEYLQAIDDTENSDLLCYESLTTDSFILKNDSFLSAVTFRLATDQIEIIPQGYPSAITHVCSGTSIPFQYSEFTQYITPKSPLHRLNSSTE